MAFGSTTHRSDSDVGYHNIPTDLARLEDLENYQIASNDLDPRGWTVKGPDGDDIGKIKSLVASPTTELAYFAIVDTGGWFSNKEYAIPLERVQFDRSDQEAYAPYTKEQFRGAPEWRAGSRDYAGYYGYWSRFHTAEPGYNQTPGDTTEHEVRGGAYRVPVTDETAQVRKERQEVGYVTLRKRSEIETKHISEPVMRTRVEVETREVPPGESYAEAGATTLREGETLRVPIVEEELTVEKTPRVTKEVVLHTTAETEQVERDIQLRHEEVDVEQEGDVDLPETASSRR
jgi:uncharacterized protein (TIGR02271 family)